MVLKQRMLIFFELLLNFSQSSGKNLIKTPSATRLKSVNFVIIILSSEGLNCKKEVL
jgi:hypothetical protein